MTQIIRTFSLDSKHIDMLDTLAEKEKRSASSIIRFALEEYYDRHKEGSE